MKKYNHLYTLAFSVNTDRHPECPVDPAEIMEALALRIVDVTTNKEWDEAIEQPSDTYLNEEVNEFRMYYKHCDTEWDMEWSCTCNDRCPVCNHEIEPYEFELIEAGIREPYESDSPSVGEEVKPGSR